MASSGVSSCTCLDGWKGADCLIRERTESSDKRNFLVKLSISLFWEATVNSSSRRSAEDTIDQISQQLTEFFDVRSSSDIKVSSRRESIDSSLTRQPEMALEAKVQLEEDFVAYERGLADTHAALIKFMGADTRRRAGPSIVVGPISMTCGEGHYRNESTRECILCQSGTYKDSPDDEGFEQGCTGCTDFHMVTKPGATRMEDCECDQSEGYMLQRENVANSSNDTSRFEVSNVFCVRSWQVVTVAQAKSVARTVSTVVGTVVASNIAVAAGTAVASALGSAAGGAVVGTTAGTTAGAAGGGIGAGVAEDLAVEEMAQTIETSSSAGGSCMLLISHVQFLNVVGQVGGSNGSKPLAAFSEGFGWANMDFPAVFPWRSSSNGSTSSNLKNRRQKKGAAADKKKEEVEIGTNQTESDEEMTCQFHSLAPSFDKVLSCILILVTVSIARICIVRIWAYCLPSRDIPTAMLFPAWEGPVLFVEYMALCDAAMETISTGCAWWVAFGASVLFFGPVLVIAGALIVLLPYVKPDDDEFYEEHVSDISKMSLRQSVTAVIKTKGLAGKLVALNYYWGQTSVQGDWNDSNATIRFWSFLIGDFTARTWVYAVWPLVRRIWMSGTVNITDGQLNAVLSLIMQSVDTILLLLVRPYNSRLDNLYEGMGGITNLCTYLILVVPLLGNFEKPAWLGDTTTMILALFSTGLKGFAAMLEPLMLLLKGAKLASKSFTGLLSQLLEICRPCFGTVSTQFKDMKTLMTSVSHGASIHRGSVTAAGNFSDEMTAQLTESLEQHYVTDPNEVDREEVGAGVGELAAAAALAAGQRQLQDSFISPNSMKDLVDRESTDAPQRAKNPLRQIRYRQSLERAFNLCAGDDSTFIHVSQLNKALQSMGLRLSEAELELMIRIHAVDGTGKIEKLKFERMVQWCLGRDNWTDAAVGIVSNAQKLASAKSDSRQQRYQAFLERLRVLRAEREMQEADSIYGQVGSMEVLRVQSLTQMPSADHVTSFASQPQAMEGPRRESGLAALWNSFVGRIMSATSTENANATQTLSAVPASAHLGFVSPYSDWSHAESYRDRQSEAIEVSAALSPRRFGMANV